MGWWGGRCVVVRTVSPPQQPFPRGGGDRHDPARIDGRLRGSRDIRLAARRRPPVTASARAGWLILQLRRLTLRRGSKPLLEAADLTLNPGERVGLIGANGSGKSSLFALLRGEKARLALALIVWQRPNLLLLDEPTNHLDLETREALTVALAQFEGTLVLVSHDRHLLRASTDEFLIVADGGLRPFDGDLDDYRDWLLRTRLARPGPAATTAGRTTDRKEQRRQEAEARQRLSAQRKPIEARIRRLEDLMARAGSRKAELDARLADPALYAEEGKDRLKALLFEQASLVKELERLETEWLNEHEALEALGA